MWSRYRCGETFQGQVVWDGTVEVFDLTGHPDCWEGLRLVTRGR